MTKKEKLQEFLSRIKPMKGYCRSKESSLAISTLLAYMLDKYPTMRLGQLITNVTSDFDSENLYKGRFYSNLLFNVYDEELVRRLQVFDEWQEHLKELVAQENYNIDSPDWVSYWEKHK